MSRLLNIGSGASAISLPPWYRGWELVRLDIEPQTEPDLLMSALELDTLDGAQFDAAYSSHFLEHVYPSDMARFLVGILHVLTDNGFVEFRVPNALTACKIAAEAGSLGAFCYKSPGGTITAWDMLYGYEPYQMRYGEPMAHHNAFDPERLSALLGHSGFGIVYVQDVKWEIRAVACKTDLSDQMKARMNIDRARGDVHSDVRPSNVGAIRQFRTVAGVPLQSSSRGRGDSDAPTSPSADRHGSVVAGLSVSGR